MTAYQGIHIALQAIMAGALIVIAWGFPAMVRAVRSMTMEVRRNTETANRGIAAAEKASDDAQKAAAGSAVMTATLRESRGEYARKSGTGRSSFTSEAEPATKRGG